MPVYVICRPSTLQNEASLWDLNNCEVTSHCSMRLCVRDMNLWNINSLSWTPTPQHNLHTFIQPTSGAVRAQNTDKRFMMAWMLYTVHRHHTTLWGERLCTDTLCSR